jgi:hypothetical protein
MAKTKVEAGICGFVTEIEADSKDFQNVSFSISTNCNNLAKLPEIIKTCDAYHELKNGSEGDIFRVTKSELKSMCTACVVPSAIFKTMQVAAGLALPKNVSIDIVK